MFDIRPHRTPEPSAPVFRCGRHPVRPPAASQRASQCERSMREPVDSASRTQQGHAVGNPGTRSGRGCSRPRCWRGAPAAPPRRRPAPAASRCSASGPRAWPAPSSRSPTTPPPSTGTRPASAPATSSRWPSSGRTSRCPPVDGVTPALRTGAILIGTPPLGRRLLPPRRTHVVPVTLVQSIGDHLNVGGAVKGVWGEGIDGRTHGRLDVDLGRDGPHRRLAGRPGPPQPRRADLRSGGDRLRREPLPARTPRPPRRRGVPARRPDAGRRRRPDAARHGRTDAGGRSPPGSSSAPAAASSSAAASAPRRSTTPGRRPAAAPASRSPR